MVEFEHFKVGISTWKFKSFIRRPNSSIPDHRRSESTVRVTLMYLVLKIICKNHGSLASQSMYLHSIIPVQIVKKIYIFIWRYLVGLDLDQANLNCSVNHIWKKLPKIFDFLSRIWSKLNKTSKISKNHEISKLPFYLENNSREYYSNFQFKMFKSPKHFLQTNLNSNHWVVFGVKRWFVSQKDY
jgi:hypothetical protein